MERKRVPASFSDVSYVNKRKRAYKESEDTTDECLLGKEDTNVRVDLPNDTLASIIYLQSIFPQKVFEGLVPPIVLKHQIYCIVKDKTLVDQQLEFEIENKSKYKVWVIWLCKNKLWSERKVQLFKLISGSDEFAVVLTEDFQSHVRKKVKPENFNILDDFLVNILPECVDVSISKQCLVKKHHYTENKITNLVNNGLLQCRDVESWWLGIPGAGVFMKHLTKGRQAILRKIKRRKFKEILLHDLEKSKIPSKLGIMYHIYDISGAELVKRFKTTTGEMLRLAT